MSVYLIAIVVAWVIAQGGKFAINSARAKGSARYRSLYESGGMPSSHSASVVALATIVGLVDGVNSAVFGIALLFAVVVMYDAVGVRRSSGEQGIALNKLLEKLGSDVKLVRVARGHYLKEVVVGALLGLVVGFLTFFVTK